MIIRLPTEAVRQKDGADAPAHLPSPCLLPASPQSSCCPVWRSSGSTCWTYQNWRNAGLVCGCRSSHRLHQDNSQSDGKGRWWGGGEGGGGVGKGVGVKGHQVKGKKERNKNIKTLSMQLPGTWLCVTSDNITITKKKTTNTIFKCKCYKCKKTQCKCNNLLT